MDSIYSPVLKVSYRVDATRAGERTDFDKLILEVETKPSITPRDAVASAGRTLVELFGLARELNVEAEGIEIGPAPVAEVLTNELSMPIEDLDLSVRSYNCLKREGINTVSELVALSETQLMNIRNFGQKSVDEQLAADLALPIEDLNFTVRSYNCLKREGVHTVGELITRSEQDLLDIRNFGSKSIDEVKAKLAEMGLGLKDSPAGFDPAAALADFDDDDTSFTEDEQY